MIPDDIIPNVRYLAEQVDDIELVLFESGEHCNIPSAKTVRELKQLATEHALTYTVHLPIDLHTGHADEAERHRAVESCIRIIDRLEPAAPFAYILHLDSDRRGNSPSEDVSAWQARHRQSLRDVLDLISPERLCIENLDYPFHLVTDIVRDFGLSVCTDIGHLLLYGRNVRVHLERHLAETRIIHLHGIENGFDHRAVNHLDSTFLDNLLQRLADACLDTRVVTLEIFCKEDFQDSIRCFAEWCDSKFLNC